MLKYSYFVILAFAMLFVGCGDNLDPIVSGDSNPQVRVEIQALVVARDTSLAELMGELYDLWFRVSITNLGDKEVTIDKSSFSMYDIKGSAIYSTEVMYVFDPTSKESIGVVTTAYILGINDETTFILKPKSTESVGLFTVVSTGPTGEWNLVYGNRQVVIPVQKRIEQVIADGKKIGDDTKANGKDVPVVENGNKDNGDNKEPIIRDDAPMVLIPAGEFQMGSNDEEQDARPVHTVYLDAFYMDKCEVTNAQYRRFMQATGYKEPEEWRDKDWDENLNGDDQPVAYVNWEDANAYAEWAGKRLPTEAEWEKAARGGLVGQKYVWGNEWPPPGRAGNLNDDIEGYVDGYSHSAPVGRFKPNGYGLYDMAGNVWEWCADWYAEDYYKQSPNRNPKGPTFGEEHVIHGGSWVDSNSHLTVALRRRIGLGFSRSCRHLGFRCAMDATK